MLTLGSWISVLFGSSTPNTNLRLAIPKPPLTPWSTTPTSITFPVMTGARGKDDLRRFYSTDFIPCMPPDTALTPVSRTIGADQLVDEMIFSFTHTVEMPWMLPGVAPTNKRVEVPLVVIVHFRDGKLAHEHIYWDQASVLKQIGLLTDSHLPVCGVETAQKVLAGMKR